jgi:hypothetical protein
MLIGKTALSLKCMNASLSLQPDPAIRDSFMWEISVWPLMRSLQRINGGRV